MELFSICSFVLLLFLVAWLQGELRKLKRSLKEIALQVGVPDPVTDELLAEITSLIAEGKRVEAVKRLRVATNFELQEASDYVNKLAAGTKTGTAG